MIGLVIQVVAVCLLQDLGSVDLADPVIDLTVKVFYVFDLVRDRCGHRQFIFQNRRTAGNDHHPRLDPLAHFGILIDTLYRFCLKLLIRNRRDLELILFLSDQHTVILFDMQQHITDKLQFDKLIAENKLIRVIGIKIISEGPVPQSSGCDVRTLCQASVLRVGCLFARRQKICQKEQNDQCHHSGKNDPVMPADQRSFVERFFLLWCLVIRHILYL